MPPEPDAPSRLSDRMLGELKAFLSSAGSKSVSFASHDACRGAEFRIIRQVECVHHPFHNGVRAENLYFRPDYVGIPFPWTRETIVEIREFVARINLDECRRSVLRFCKCKPRGRSTKPNAGEQSNDPRPTSHGGKRGLYAPLVPLGSRIVHQRDRREGLRRMVSSQYAFDLPSTT